MIIGHGSIKSEFIVWGQPNYDAETKKANKSINSLWKNITESRIPQQNLLSRVLKKKTTTQQMKDQGKVTHS